MKKESITRKYVKDLVKKANAASIRLAWSWVESHATSPGIPDAYYCLDGVPGWLELKALPDEEVRNTQEIWMRENVRAGGFPLFLVQDGMCFHIVPGSRAADIRRDPSRENIERLASTTWKGSIDLDQFLNVLRHPGGEYEKR